MSSQFLIESSPNYSSTEIKKQTSITSAKTNLSDGSYYSYMSIGVAQINYALIGMMIILFIYILFPNPLLLILFVILLVYIIITLIFIITYVNSRMPSDFNQSYIKPPKPDPEDE